LEEILLGADGWVAGLVCAFPAETVAVFKLAKAGKIQEAIKEISNKYTVLYHTF
jgi:4-hydroxy-tetrahydrodipicolinate synthase